MAIIPAKNPAALIGYYLGVGSLVPVFGMITALPALICGIVGLTKSKAKPEIAGKGHAITAITLSIVGPVGWFALALFMFNA